MAAPAITLGAGQVLITNSTSVLGIYSVDNKVQFGTVALVNDLSDKVTVNDSVMYDKDKVQSTLIYGSTLYLLIDEKYISGIETDLP